MWSYDEDELMIGAARILVPRNCIFKHDGWLVIKYSGTAIAYHKKGATTVLTITESTREEDIIRALQNVNTKWPLSTIDVDDPERVYYTFFIREDGTFSRYYGCTRVMAANPEKAIKIALKYYKLFHILPIEVTDNGAYANYGDTKITLRDTDDEVVIENYPSYHFRPSQVKNFKPEGTKEITDTKTGTTVHYVIGVPYRVEKNTHFFVNREDGETDDDFNKIIETIKQIRVEEGAPPYRAEVSSQQTLSWIKIGNRLVEIHLPYGKRLSLPSNAPLEVEYVRAKIPATLIDHETVESVMTTLDKKKYIIIRAFSYEPPLVRDKETGKYFLYGDDVHVNAENPEEALKLINTKRYEEEKKQDRSERGQSDEAGTVKIQTLKIKIPVDIDIVKTIRVLDTPSNRKKVRQILKRLHEEYEQVHVYPPESVRSKIREIAKDLHDERYIVVASGVYDRKRGLLIPYNYDNGSFSYDENPVSTALQELFYEYGVQVEKTINENLKKNPIEYLPRVELQHGEFLHTRNYPDPQAVLQKIDQYAPLLYTEIDKHNIRPVIYAADTALSDENEELFRVVKELPARPMIVQRLEEILRREGVKRLVIEDKEVFVI